MSNITEEMYLLAKQVVTSYENKEKVSDTKSRSYTYGDMKKCFSSGVDRGCYIASLIQNNPIDKFDKWDEFMQKNHA